jgi:hypothetical protein
MILKDQGTILATFLARSWYDDIQGKLCLSLFRKKATVDMIEICQMYFTV